MVTRDEAEKRVLKEFMNRPPENILKYFVDGYLQMHNKQQKQPQAGNKQQKYAPIPKKQKKEQLSLF